MARLPVELYEIVLEHCSRSDLITLARVSRTTQPEAERILYRDVKFPADTRGAVTSAVMFCKRICQSSRRAAYVITLLSEIGLSSAYSLPTLRRLFSRTVARIPNLRILRVVKSELLDFVILTQSHLKLWSFESDSDDGTTLFEFLITQSELRSLSLRLFLPNAIHFPLSPHLLPNLTVLLASACDAPHIMLGRPVSHVYIWDKPKVFLANLKGSATGVKVLRVFVVSPTTMKTIAHVVPNVEVLLAQPYIRVSYVCDTKTYQCRHLLICASLIGYGRFHHSIVQPEEATHSGFTFPIGQSLEFGSDNRALNRQDMSIGPYTDSQERCSRGIFILVDLEIGYVRDETS
jgi:hypothetical protein